MFRVTLTLAFVAIWCNSSHVRVAPLDAHADVESLLVNAESVQNNEIEIHLDSISTWVSDDDIESHDRFNSSRVYLIPSHVRALTNVEINELDQQEIQACERKFASIGGIVILLFILPIALVVKFAIHS